MGNSTSKKDGDEAQENLNQNESFLSGEEQDSLSYQNSKSTVGSEGTEHRSPSDKSKNGINRLSSTSNASNRSSSRANKRQTSSQSSRYAKENSAIITDDQVHVNLPMADLMAYLQVVANNSNNLPLTKRDDPELGRSVSRLDAEEYARKSAAFIPSDVRVISGAFARYGRVWDLPTSEEFDACDGAQEPGRSYGGACCNSMLKVLYDSANDTSDAAQNKEASDALFDDDEDEESIVGGGKSIKTFHSLEFAPSNPATISWATLLRLMKAEISDVEHAQHPTICTTRKMDLNQPFSIVPRNFDPSTGKKRSLLIGCIYTNIHGAELKASHDDIRSMKDYIVNVHGFPETEDLMTVLLDDDNHTHPTHLNITEAFKTLSEQSQPGDAVFVQFSGHGGRVLDAPIDSEAESYDEVIVPSDYKVSGLIRDTLIFKTLLAPMKYGVTVTMLIDACDTGMTLDLPYRWNTKGDKDESLAKLSLNDDFSFVRFLKVVRTLYESSTFTQLGKTVGSMLKHNPDPPMTSAPRDENGNTDNEGDETLPPQESTVTKIERKVATSMDQESLFSSLIYCGSPAAMAVVEEKDFIRKKIPKKEDSRRKIGALVPFEEHKRKKAPVASQSLMEQMMGSKPLVEQIINCTLAHGEDDYSDDDDESYCRTVDGASYSIGSSTFETMTDDGSRSTPRGTRRRARRH